jgi:DNA primase catalytic core
MIPPAFVHELLSRVDIVEIVGRSVELKRAGATWKGLCPFHGEKSPSFTVSPSRQTYHCFGCGVHGNAVGFLIEQHGMGFVDAVRDLAQHAGLAVPKTASAPGERDEAARQKQKQLTLSDVLARAAAGYRRQLKASERAVAYLKGRGLSGEIAARFGLGYATDSWRGLASVFPNYDDPSLEESGLVIAQGDEGGRNESDGPPSGKRYDRFRDRIMFPIRSVQGSVIGFGGRVLDRGEPKYLNSPETPVFSKGRELYGLFEARTAIRQRGYALVVEGYMDVVALAQAGFENAVATLGTACTAEHVHKLAKFTDAIVFSFDGDAAGRRAAARALEASLPHAGDTRTFRFLFLPPEHDPDSFVRELGAPAFEAAVARAVPLSRPDRRRCRRRPRSLDRRGPGAFPGQRQAALVGAAGRHAETPAARRVRVPRCAAAGRARGSMARRRSVDRASVAWRTGGAHRSSVPARPAAAERRRDSRPTALPGCCSSKAPGGRRFRLPTRPRCARCPVGTASCSDSWTVRRRSTARVPGRRCASESPASRGRRRRSPSSTVKTRPSSRLPTISRARSVSCVAPPSSGMRCGSSAGREVRSIEATV